jgi:hypothetical protein
VGNLAVCLCLAIGLLQAAAARAGAASVGRQVTTFSDKGAAATNDVAGQEPAFPRSRRFLLFRAEWNARPIFPARCALPWSPLLCDTPWLSRRQTRKAFFVPPGGNPSIFFGTRDATMKVNRRGA